MRDYARKCGYSLGILINCDGNSRRAQNPGVVPCVAKEQFDGAALIPTEKGARLRYQELENFNILAGHINMNIYQSFQKSYNGKVGREILFTWMRDPLSMLISSSTFLIRKKSEVSSVSEIVNKMLSKLQHESRLHTSSNVYSQYISYYSDGGSKAHRNASLAGLLPVIKSSMSKFSVIGLIENHVTSIRMLWASLDPRSSLGQSFWQEAMVYERNKSDLVDEKGAELDKAAVLTYLNANTHLLDKLKEGLRAEYEIYRWGVELHRQQCEILAKKNPEILSVSQCEVPKK